MENNLSVGTEAQLIELLQHHLIDSLVAQGISIQQIETDVKTQQWILAEVTALLGIFMDTFNCKEINVDFLDSNISVYRTDSVDNRKNYISNQVDQLIEDKPELADKVSSIFENSD